jgi:hypothetical protein
MIGDYTRDEISAMSAMELVRAQQAGFIRPPIVVPAAGFPSMGHAVVELPPDDAPEPSDNVWGNRAKDEQDFVAPSGQKCRLKRLKPEDLLPLGILDKITRLEGLANDLVARAEGQPPEKQTMPSEEDLKTLLETVNLLMPIAIMQPKVYADDDPAAPVGSIRVSDIDLMDRISIMEHSLRKIRGLDRFRHAG